jgi:hypothetical protein
MRLSDYRVGREHLRFCLEWDRGTMHVRDLAVKFSSYARYMSSREWARECSVLPALVCVAPDIAQERRMVRVAQTRLRQDPGLALYTTTEVLLKEYGPCAGIWLKRRSQHSHEGQAKGVLRENIFGDDSRKDDHMLP